MRATLWLQQLARSGVAPQHGAGRRNRLMPQGRFAAQLQRASQQTQTAAPEPEETGFQNRRADRLDDIEARWRRRHPRLAARLDAERAAPPRREHRAETERPSVPWRDVAERVVQTMARLHVSGEAKGFVRATIFQEIATNREMPQAELEARISQAMAEYAAKHPPEVS